VPFAEGFTLAWKSQLPNRRLQLAAAALRCGRLEGTTSLFPASDARLKALLRAPTLLAIYSLR